MILFGYSGDLEIGQAAITAVQQLSTGLGASLGPDRSARAQALIEWNSVFRAIGPVRLDQPETIAALRTHVLESVMSHQPQKICRAGGADEESLMQNDRSRPAIEWPDRLEACLSANPSGGCRCIWKPSRNK